MANTPAQIAAAKALQAKRIANTAAGIENAGGKKYYADTNTVVETPVVTETPTSPVLPFSKDTATYKELTAKGYTDQMIVDAYNKAQSARTPEQQAKTKALETPAAPVNVNIQQPEKETPAKVVEPKKEVVKTPAQLQAEADAIRYNDDTEPRLNEIAANLNDAVIKNPNSLKTLDAFKKTYSVDPTIRSEKQVQSMLDWYSGYQKSIKLGLTPVNDIMTGYDNGTITSTDLETLKATNPTKYAEVQTAIENKKELKKFQEELYGVKESTIGVADTTADVDDPNLFDEYKAAINSDEAKALNTSIADQDGKISQLKLKLLDIEKDVEKRYEGTGATKGKIAYIVAKEQAEIQKQISELSIDMNTSINKYNSIVNTAKDIMTLGLQEKTAEQQERAAKMQELGFFYQYTPEGMAQMATAKYNAENPDLDSPNVGTSTMALNQTLDAYYKDYGDIIQRPKAQVVSDVMKYAKSKGISVSQALKENFITPLQNKDAYKAKVRKDYGLNTEYVTIDGVTYEKDPLTGKLSIPNVPSAPTTPIDLTNPSGLGDLSTSTLVTAYPNEASFKNNNPTGIKMSASQTLKDMWTKAGIKFTDGTKSPEGGNYVKFDTMENGLKAYQIALSSRGDDIYARLKQWKGVGDTEGYANQIMSEAGIEKGAKFSSLSPEKMNALMNAHLKRESSGLYKYMQGQSTTGDGNLTERANMLKSTMGKQARDSFDEALKATGGNTQLMENLIKDMEIDKYYDRIKDPLKNYQKAEEPLKEINNAFSRIDAVWQSYKADPKSVTSKNSLDQVLVIGLNKILDPGSVVRESEFARAPEGMSFFNKREGKIAKIQEGGVGLTDSERTEIINAVTLMKQGQQGAINKYKDELLLAGKTLNVPEPFVYGLIGGESKFNVGGSTQKSSGTTYNYGGVQTPQPFKTLQQILAGE